MAEPKTTKSFLILLGDGETPEVFGHPCGANTQSVKLTNSTGEETLLDCDDPLEVIAAVSRWVESQDTSVDLAGRVAVGSFRMWQAWADGGFVKNIRLEALNTVALGGGFWTLPAILSDLDLGKEGSGTITFSATIVGAGRRIWTDAT